MSAPFREHNVPSPRIIEQRSQAILAATALTSDSATIENHLLVETPAPNPYSRHVCWPRRARGASESACAMFQVSAQVALRALAFKRMRVLDRCWQNRTPYGEATYLNAFKRRGSPLLSGLQNPGPSP